MAWVADICNLGYAPGLRYLGLGTWAMALGLVYLIYAIWAKVPGLRNLGLGT